MSSLSRLLTPTNRLGFLDWSGGPEFAGVWTGDRFTSNFIREPTLDRPPQGIVSTYYDTEAKGIWSQKNAAQRLGQGSYWAFVYLPMLLALLLSRYFKVLDDEVKRIDKFYRLRKPVGIPTKRSLCLDYHGFWSRLSVVQAIRYRHWTVAISSIGLVLGSIAIPISQNYLFNWRLYSGGRLPWADEYSWQVGLVDPYWANVLTAQLALAMGITTVLYIRLPTRKTYLRKDIRGVMGLVSMCAGGLPAITRDDHRKSALQIYEKLGHSIYRLVEAPNSSQLILQSRISHDSGTEPAILREHQRLKKMYQAIKALAVKFWKFTETARCWVAEYVNDQPTCFVFRPETFALWLLVLLTLMIFTAYIAATMNGNAKDNMWNYNVPLPADLYLIVVFLYW